MEYLENVELKDYLTMKIGGKARYFVNLTSKDDLIKINKFSKDNKLKIFVLGGGSNTISSSEMFEGIVIHNKIKGIKKLKEDENKVTFSVASGEILDDFIDYVSNEGLTGLEAMSLIPGTIGATPVQNVGAFGQQIGDVLDSLEAFDFKENKFKTFTNKDLKFAYRYSIFKEKENFDRYFITNLILTLHKGNIKMPLYHKLEAYMQENNITDVSPKSIRNSVIAVREQTLPAVEDSPSSGSFFKNAIVDKNVADRIKKQFPDAKIFEDKNGKMKISTGWMIESLGLKGKVLYGMRVWDKNAIILVNESATGYQDLNKAREEIKKQVFNKFEIEINQEVVEID